MTPGTRIGSYEVIAPVGAGGMGEVHRARDTKLNRDVAIKVLPELFAGDPDRLARFQREAQVLAALNHPNIGQIYGLEATTSGGGSALVMEFVEGEDLAQRLARGALPLEEAVAIGAQIANALEAAHEQGIIHRDLKPANVRVRPDGTVKVLDFGLAKAMDPAMAAGGGDTMSPTLTARATQLGTIIGTAAYMAPEQAKGKAVDRRADVWAFGVVLYEMLTGARAFKGDDVSDTLAAVLRADVDLKALPAGTPSALRTLIDRCLTRDPRQRLRDIGEARVVLEHLRGGPVEEEKPAALAATPIAAPRPFWKRALVPLASFIAGAAAAGYGAWLLKPEPPRPVTRFLVMLPENQIFTNSGRKMIALSPDGARLAYIANRQIFVRPLAGFETHAIPGGDSPGNTGIHYVVFSPNGQELAYRTAGDGLLKRLPVAGGAPVTISAIPPPSGLVWTEQGIFFGVPGKGILRVSPNGGTPDLVAGVGADETADAPDVLPGGQALLFSIKKNSETWDQARVVVQTLRDGARQTVVDGGADAKYVETGHVVYAVAGVLFAVPFDLGSMSVTGAPVSVVEGVRRGGLAATATATALYALSRAGTLAYLPGPAAVGRTGDAILAIFDRKGPGRPLKVPQGSYSAPRVSSDGKYVAVERENDAEADVWIYEVAETTAMRRLTFGGKNRAPVWSGESRWVAFQSDREGDAGIYRQLADGSAAAERLTKAESGATHIPQSWSPDNRYLLYTEQRRDKQSLWLLNVVDRRAAPFAGIESLPQLEAAFSPDGKWVAYTSREDPGGRNTFVVPFPPTGARYVVPIGGGHAFWFPDGEALHLNVGPGESAIVSVRTAPQFGFGQPDQYPRQHSESDPATSRRNVDALPNGRLLGVTARPDQVNTGSDNLALNVVLNWNEELKQRVPAR